MPLCVDSNRFLPRLTLNGKENYRSVIGVAEPMLKVQDFARMISDGARSARRRRIQRFIRAGSFRESPSIERFLIPQVRMLEPRVVLNATAELNMLGQLVITSAADSDIVNLQIDSGGDLLLRDGDGGIIPIENHPDGPNGSTNPLRPDDVTSGQVVFDMGGGDDALDLQLPSGLDVSVAPSDGDDSAILRFSNNPSTDSDLIEVDSERITIDPTTRSLELFNDQIVLRGDVVVGDQARTQLGVPFGSLVVEGRLILAGDLLLTGPGTVDFSSAIITSSTANANLQFALSQDPASVVSIGGADDSGGDFLSDLQVLSSGTATFTGEPLLIGDDLVIRDVAGPTVVDSQIQANSVSVLTPGEVAINAQIVADGGGITVLTLDSLVLRSDLQATSGNRLGAIQLLGDSIELNNAEIRTAGAMVNVSGPVTVGGDVLIDTGDSQRAAVAGDVQFIDAIVGSDQAIDTLRINAVGDLAGGWVRLQAPIGMTPVSTAAVDLNELVVNAARIEINSVGVSDGDIRLSGDTVRLFGNELRTRTTGDVVIDGALLIPVGSSTVVAADTARFESTVQGQVGTNDFSVAAGNAAIFEGAVLSLRDLDVAADQIRVSGGIDTTFGVDGNVRLGGSSNVIVNNDSVVRVGDASIEVDAGGGMIDTADSTLQSDSTAVAVTLRNASNVLLGNVVAERGELALGINQDVSGEIQQATGTSLQVDRLSSGSGGSIDLSNRGNEIRLLRSVITSDGSITIDSETTMEATEVISNNLGGLDDPGGNGSPASRDIQLTVHNASSDLLVGSVRALNGADVTLISDDDILDTDPSDASILFADDLRVETGNLSPDQDASVRLTTQISELTARLEGTLRGDLVITEVDAITLASSDQLDASDRIVTGNGRVSITAGGTINVASRPGGAAAIDAGGGRAIELSAQGASSDILVQRAIQSDAGTIQLAADRDIRLTADGDVLSRGGDVIVRADIASAVLGGEFEMDDGAVIDAQSGTISIDADQDVVLGSLFTTNATDDAVVITSRSAALVDGGDQHFDIDANRGRVTIRTVSGIGQGDALETRIDRIDTSVTSAGQTNLDEDDAIVLESVITQDGSITIRSGLGNAPSANLSGTELGTITALSVSSRGTVNQDVRLIAAGNTSDIEVGSIVAAGQSDVELQAGDDIINLGGAVPLVADDLELTSNNLTGDRDAAIMLATRVNDLQGQVRGMMRGDMVITETDAINLAMSDAMGDEILQTGNGQIVITASDITVFDNSPGDDGADLKDDPEIIARGIDHGRIEIIAANELRLHDEVQFQTEKERAGSLYPMPATRPSAAAPTDGPLRNDPALAINDRSVYLRANSVVLGQRIELHTGDNQGTARIFSPRPEVLERVIDPISGDPALPMPRTDGILPAFFDPFSVRTNVLEQAVVNDSTGILTLDIGQQGEQGLTVDIDWGAPEVDDEFGRPRRFQQLNGLSADESITFGLGGPDGIDPVFQERTPADSPRLRVEHFYSQANIVESELNGREASTKPLEVRFAVRHHESILVEASTVQQGPDLVMETDFGGIVSSTDDPGTPRESLPGLENGQATFLIPSLSIPVAFFPVRDVIPEIEETQFLVRDESAVTLSQGTFDTSESSSVPVPVRDEFFQIRILSPDPDGQDLASPQKLPDDILDGDKIRRLFAELPDGRYEIEYVLGDAIKRSVLRVDVRGGEATIPEDGLNEGILELIPVDARELLEILDGEHSKDSDGSEATEVTPPVEVPDVRAETTSDDQDSASQAALPADAASTLPPIAGSVAVVSALRRRLKMPPSKRLSFSGRFARRIGR